MTDYKAIEKQKAELRARARKDRAVLTRVLLYTCMALALVSACGVMRPMRELALVSSATYAAPRSQAAHVPPVTTPPKRHRAHKRKARKVAHKSCTCACV